MKMAFERASLHPHTFSADGVPRKGCNAIHRTLGLQALSVSTRDMATKWRLGSGIEATLIRGGCYPRWVDSRRLGGVGRHSIPAGVWPCVRGRGHALRAGLWAGGVAVCPGAWLCPEGGAMGRGVAMCGVGRGRVGRGLGLCWSRVTVLGASASEGQADFRPAVLECVGCHVCRIPPPAPLQLW